MSSSGSEGEEEEVQLRPIYAQYAGSDEEFDDSEDEGSGSDAGSNDAGSQDDNEEEASDFDEDEAEIAARERALKKELANVPFGALVKAQGQLAKGQGKRGGKGKQKAVEEEQPEEAPAPARKRKASDLESREDKHAPTELSSRRPVSRRREVVEVAKPQRRDPRFSSLSGGAVSKHLFKQSYGFVEDMQSSELSTLKQTLSSLRNQERHHAGPRATSAAALAIRAEREQVEQALRRAESRAAERDRRARLERVEKQQKEKNAERVKAGLQPFYLKESDKKALVLKDKFDRLASGSGPKGARGAAAEGGAAAAADGGRPSNKKLKKALERRRKKNAAKERKDLPFITGKGRHGQTAAQPQRFRSGDK